MIKVLEYAVLSNHIYDIKNPLFGERQFTLKQGSRNYILPNGWMLADDIASNITPANPFFAALYIKFSNLKATNAVLVVRGTANTDNDIADAESWFSSVGGNGVDDSLPKYMPLAISFLMKVKKYLQKYYPQLSHKLRFTGHSLGGAIAKLLMLFYSPSRPTVVFNAPCVGEIKSVPEHGSSIYGINARYGFVNKIGVPVYGSHVYWVDIPNHERDAEILFKNFNKKLYKTSMRQYAAGDQSSSILYKSANDVDGFVERVTAYLQDGNTLLRLDPELRKSFNECEKQVSQHWIKNILTADYPSLKCRFKLEGKAFWLALMGQHAMLHMVKTLSTTQYEKLANTYI